MNAEGMTAFLVATLAGMLRERHHVVVGSNLPIPAAAALLARRASGGALAVDILGSHRHSRLVGIAELYDFACQGRFDGFFLSPGQIDGRGNVNLVGVGAYPRLDVRWSGSHGSPLLYMMIPNVILFRDSHRRRTLVPAVDFISAPGSSAPNVYRPGGPSALVTSLAHFSFDRAEGGFRLESVHPGHSEQEVGEHTGFAFRRAANVGVTAPPEPSTLACIGDEVVAEVAELYPLFARKLAASVRVLREAVPSRLRG